MKKKFKWIKKGRIYEARTLGYTHGSHPCILHFRDSQHILAFTIRDGDNKSHICLAKCVVDDDGINMIGEVKLALYPGMKGYFDCDGVISACFVEYNNVRFLYYVGWQNLQEGMWLCDTGRTIVDVETLALQREFDGPVLGRDKNNPLFAAGTAFLIIDEVWHTWYNSGLRWEQTTKGLKHYYGIHHATSSNGVDWECEKGMCIPFANEYEYAFGRPCVIKINGEYCMWFAHRATKKTDKYRMGFAYSSDGNKWVRDDSLAGIDVSPAGWDSDMICYPYVFEHNGKYYMLYNGNGYGRTGFGLAVMEGSV